MFRTDADHTVTVRRPDPESGALVNVDVAIRKGKHTPGKDPDVDLALEQLWSAGLAVDDDRPEVVEVTDIVTGEPVVVDVPTPDTAPEV